MRKLQLLLLLATFTLGACTQTLTLGSTKVTFESQEPQADYTNPDDAADLSTGDRLLGTEGYSNFTTVSASDDVIAADDITAGDDLIVTDDATFMDDVTLSNGTQFNQGKQSPITVTNLTGFSPTGRYQPITSAGTVTPTITILTAGIAVTLVNTGTQTINFADTGIQKLTAAFAMGQTDTLTVWSDGTNWYEVARANN